MPIVYINRRSNKNGRSVSINEKSDSNNKKENALWKTKKKKSAKESRDHTAEQVQSRKPVFQSKKQKTAFRK